MGRHTYYIYVVTRKIVPWLSDLNNGKGPYSEARIVFKYIE